MSRKPFARPFQKGGPQTVLFLTELGLIRLLNMSRKPFARTFQKWDKGTAGVVTTST
jgi:prophage antirepressor-like protein